MGWNNFAAAENFLFCNASAAVLGGAMLRTSAHQSMGAFALLTGLIGVTGLACIELYADFGLGPGGIERATAYPFQIWISCMGAWLLRSKAPGAKR